MSFEFVDIQADDAYGLEGSSVSMLCKAKLAIDYCWFSDPTGKRISISDRSPIQSSDKYR